jgi:3-oxoacyl-[acyl-carrier protein] reductase
LESPRVVLVTGGNRGIGYAIAQEFVSAGYKVAVTARSGSGPKGTLSVVADVTDAGSLDAAISKIESELGPIQVLVANAGITKDTLLLRMSDEDFERVIDTNLTGVFRVLKRVTKSMLKAKFGRVIFIGSVVGVLGSAGQVNYAASKSALIGMARSVTRELGSRNITANVVAPGFIDTDMTEALGEDLQKSYIDRIPAGRFASPEEVAKVVRWMASEEASYISGAVIPVDGGLGMGH